MAAVENKHPYSYGNRPVSYYVMKFLELKVGEQDHLMAARNMMKWKCQDKAIMVARAAKEIGSKAFVKNFKFCYDDGDDTVYCLVHLDHLAAEKRRYCYHVGQETISFFEVKSITERKSSKRDFVDMDIRTRGDRSIKTVDNEIVSLFVVEHLDLVPGAQNRLLAAKGLESEDKVKLVARVVQQNRGGSSLPKFRYALDGVNGTVYVLVGNAQEAQLMAGRSFRVNRELMSFYRVLNIETRSAVDDIYQSGYVDKVWPNSAR